MLKNNNDLTTSVNSNAVKFQFSYNDSTEKYGYLDQNGEFVPFEEGGTDISDTTATASDVLNTKYFYTSQGVKTQGSIITRSASSETIQGNKTYSSGYYPSSWTVTGLNTSDATAYAKNIESGYTAYCRGEKITGTAEVYHTLKKYTGTIQTKTYMLAWYKSGSTTDYGIHCPFNYYISPFAYDKYLTYHNISLTTYQDGGSGACATSFNNYVCAMNGQGGKIKIDNSLTVSYWSSNNSRGAAMASINSKFMITGGYASSVTNVAYAFDSNFTMTTASNMSSARWDHAGASIGNYMLFAGGSSSSSYSSSMLSSVDIYDSSLVRSNGIALSVPKTNQPAGESNGTYITIAGGYETGNGKSSVNAYNSNLVQSIPASLPNATNADYIGSGTVNGFMVFAGGGSASDMKAVTAYDKKLTQTICDDLSAGRSGFGGAVVDKYIIFCGGYGNSASQYASDVYYVD